MLSVSGSAAKGMVGRLTGGALVLGALALAACGSEPGSVSAGGPAPDETTTTTTVAETTTTAPPLPTTSAPATVVPPAAPPCTDDALQPAANQAFGNQGPVTVIECVGEWASGSTRMGPYDPPIYVLFRAEGDHWVAVERGFFECEPFGVPEDAAGQLGC